MDNYLKPPLLPVDKYKTRVSKPVYNGHMDLSVLFVYWIYGMIGLSGLLVLLAIKESIWPGDK